MQIEFGGELLILRTDKTMFWPAENVLFAADLHFGKLAHFRKNGSGIPEAGIETVIHRLENAINETSAGKLIILGDFFHSHENAALDDLIENWPFRTQTAIILGNHDLPEIRRYRQLGFEVFPEGLNLGPFHLTHIPIEPTHQHKFCISGHVHPAVRISGKARQHLRLPCFYVSHDQIILPALGIFTGMHTIKRSNKEDRAYAIAGEKIFEISEF